jgi:hypothetical protein
MQVRLLVSSIVLVTGSLFTNVLFAEEPKAIWGTDGAAIKKDDPQIKSPTLSTVKPKETLQPVEQKPKIAEPGTPRAMGDDPWVGGPGRK